MESADKDWTRFSLFVIIKDSTRLISRFYIRAQFSTATKCSLTKSRKRYFFRSFFSSFIITFCIGFTRRKKKYVKVIDDGICNRKIEFKAKSELMIRNRNKTKKLTRKYGVLKCKEIVALSDFLYKF